MFHPSHSFFGNWFSNESDLDSGAAGDDGRIHYTAVDLLLLRISYRSMIVVGSLFKWYTLY